MNKLAFLLVIVIMLVSVISACGAGKQTPVDTSTDEQGEPHQTAPELASTWPEFIKFHEVQVLSVEQGWTGPEKTWTL